MEEPRKRCLRCVESDTNRKGKRVAARGNARGRVLGRKRRVGEPDKAWKIACLGKVRLCITCGRGRRIKSSVSVVEACLTMTAQHLEPGGPCSRSELASLQLAPACPPSFSAVCAHASAQNGMSSGTAVNRSNTRALRPLYPQSAALESPGSTAGKEVFLKLWKVSNRDLGNRSSQFPESGFQRKEPWNGTQGGVQIAERHWFPCVGAKSQPIPGKKILEFRTARNFRTQV